MTRRAFTALVCVDHSIRELFGGTLLAHYLASAGVTPILCNTMTFSEYYARYQPDAVVWPNAQWDLSWVAERSLVFVLPSESGSGQPDAIAMLAGTPKVPAYPRPVTRFFCWGPAMRDILMESGVWSPEQLLVTGSPATDHWLLPRSAGTGDRRVGFTTMFRGISNSAPPRKWNAFEWLDDIEQIGGEGLYYSPPEHAEAWLFVEASIARVMLGLVRTVAVDRGREVEIRPHPFELATRYKYFERLPGGRVAIHKQGTISEWLERVFILFTCVSTSALDAMVRGVPVASMEGLIDPDARRKIPRTLRYSYEKWVWPLESLDQAVEYVEQAESGRLAPCRDEAALARFLADFFAYPRHQPAAATVAAHIVGILEEHGSGVPRTARRRPVHGVRRLLHAVAGAVPFAAPSVALARYAQGWLPGHVDLRFTYWPWRRRDRLVAQSAVDALLAAVERQRTG